MSSDYARLPPKSESSSVSIQPMEMETPPKPLVATAQKCAGSCLKWILGAVAVATTLALGLVMVRGGIPGKGAAETGAALVALAIAVPVALAGVLAYQKWQRKAAAAQKAKYETWAARALSCADIQLAPPNARSDDRRLSAPYDERIGPALARTIQESEYEPYDAQGASAHVAEAARAAEVQQNGQVNNHELPHLVLASKLPSGGTVRIGKTVFHYGTSRDLLNVGIAESRGRRAEMEDTHLAKAFPFTADDRQIDAQLIAVFDGHGDQGLCSAHARKNVIPLLQKHLNTFCEQGVTRVGILNAMNATCVELSRTYTGEGGSTANLNLIINNKLYTSNVGDSRSLLVSGNRTTQQLSEDQKPEAPKYRQRIEKYGGRVIVDQSQTPRVNGVLAPARSLGDHEHGRGAMSARPETTETDLGVGKKTLIVGCDGIFDALSSNQVGAIATGILANPSATPALAAASITELAYRGGSGDNLTCLVVVLE